MGLASSQHALRRLAFGQDFVDSRPAQPCGSRHRTFGTAITFHPLDRGHLFVGEFQSSPFLTAAPRLAGRTRCGLIRITECKSNGVSSSSDSQSGNDAPLVECAWPM